MKIFSVYSEYYDRQWLAKASDASRAAEKTLDVIERTWGESEAIEARGGAIEVHEVFTDYDVIETRDI